MSTDFLAEAKLLRSAAGVIPALAARETFLTDIGAEGRAFRTEPGVPTRFFLSGMPSKLFRATFGVAETGFKGATLFRGTDVRLFTLKVMVESRRFSVSASVSSTTTSFSSSSAGADLSKSIVTFRSDPESCFGALAATGLEVLGAE